MNHTFLTAMLLKPLTASQAAEIKAGSPNIVFVLTDDQRLDAARDEAVAAFKQHDWNQDSHLR